ncbi:MAG: SPOR domain-containing protein [Chitinispirillia bacterium]|nr:SPOR domain-containing protein [Chitinispirillia bacterium]MCL2267664.1 SPOR domain-containing protein [Chitinispirillia bacterium]
MKRFLFALTVVSATLALLASACVSTAKRPGTTGGTADDDRAVPDPRTQYSPSAGRTFLDTLNQGKEVALSPEDLPVLEEVATVNLTATPGAAAAGGAADPQTPPRYRIQILASSQIDMVRQAKLNAEAAVDLPVFMVSEQALYKLYIGNFKTKQEAEAVLPEIKKKGYKDAWIVSK